MDCTIVFLYIKRHLFINKELLIPVLFTSRIYILNILQHVISTSL